MALKGDLIMQDVVKYLWCENTERGARIIGCDEEFEGAMEIPSALHGVPVVEIGKEAFLGLHSLKSVAIPDSVEVVGERAFKDCDGLNELRLGRGIKKIEKEAFRWCKSLTSVAIPDSVKFVGYGAFAECYRLNELRLGRGIKKIEAKAFDSCSSLKSVVIPGSGTPSKDATNSKNFSWERGLKRSKKTLSSIVLLFTGSSFPGPLKGSRSISSVFAPSGGWSSSTRGPKTALSGEAIRSSPTRVPRRLTTRRNI